MYKLNKISLSRYNTLHPDLKRVVDEVLKHADCTIIEGVRTLETQQEYVKAGKSKTLNSRHLPNKDGLSEAMDIIAYPIDWKDNARNYLFTGFVKGIAAGIGVKLRIGADWDGDFDIQDQTFHDIVHVELDNKG